MPHPSPSLAPLARLVDRCQDFSPLENAAIRFVIGNADYPRGVGVERSRLEEWLRDRLHDHETEASIANAIDRVILGGVFKKTLGFSQGSPESLMLNDDYIWTNINQDKTKLSQLEGLGESPLRVLLLMNQTGVEIVKPTKSDELAILLRLENKVEAMERGGDKAQAGELSKNVFYNLLSNGLWALITLVSGASVALRSADDTATGSRDLPVAWYRNRMLEGMDEEERKDWEESFMMIADRIVPRECARITDEILADPRHADLFASWRASGLSEEAIRRQVDDLAGLSIVMLHETIVSTAASAAN